MSQSQPRSRASPKPSLKSQGVGTPREQVKNLTQTLAQIQGRGLGLLPSPAFELPLPDRNLNRTGSPKTVGFDESALQTQAPAQEEARDLIGLEQDSAELDFQPFFALISDGVTAEHYHPTVHYVFRDDEEGEELVSEGVVRALGGLGIGKVEEQKESQKEHVLILDVDVKSPVLGEPPRYEVIQAQSLSAEWQIGSVEVTSAPTMSHGEAEEGNGDGGFMLRVEGRGLPGDDDGVEMGREGLESLLGRYERGLVEIRRMAGLKMGEGEGV